MIIFSNQVRFKRVFLSEHGAFVKSIEGKVGHKMNNS